MLLPLLPLFTADAAMKLQVPVVAALSAVAEGSASYINYTTVGGYFLQDLTTTNTSTFDYVRGPYRSASMLADASRRPSILA